LKLDLLWKTLPARNGLRGTLKASCDVRSWFWHEQKQLRPFLICWRIINTGMNSVHFNFQATVVVHDIFPLLWSATFPYQYLSWFFSLCVRVCTLGKCTQLWLCIFGPIFFFFYLFDVPAFAFSFCLRFCHEAPSCLTSCCSCMNLSKKWGTLKVYIHSLPLAILPSTIRLHGRRRKGEVDSESNEAKGPDKTNFL